MPQKLKAGKRTATEIKQLIDASYNNKPPEKIDNWVLDKKLSTDTAKVYYDPSTGEANVIHRGTSGASDWLNNASYVLGNYESTDRYKQGKKVQKKAEKKYGAENISTLGHSQGSVLSRKLGKNTKEIINVNPAHKGEKELKNEYNIRSKSDVVSGVKGLIGLVAPSKKTTTVASKNPLDILGEHSPDILDRLGDKSIGVGAGKNIISSNNIMKGGRRVSNLNYTGEDIDWYNGGLLPESAYQNIGKTPIGVIGGERYQSSDSESDSDEEMVGGDIFKSISKGVKKFGKSVSKQVEKGTEAVGKTVAPITKGVEKATEAMSKVTDKINPMTYALDSKPISGAMGSLGKTTNDYLLPAVVQAGKPIYDASAMAASSVLTGNPILGKVAADSLWNEMVAKKGVDPRQNQKSKLLGKFATAAGESAAAGIGGRRRRKGGGAGASTAQPPPVAMAEDPIREAIIAENAGNTSAAQNEENDYAIANAEDENNNEWDFNDFDSFDDVDEANNRNLIADDIFSIVIYDTNVYFEIDTKNLKNQKFIKDVVFNFVYNSDYDWLINSWVDNRQKLIKKIALLIKKIIQTQNNNIGVEVDNLDEDDLDEDNLNEKSAFAVITTPEELPVQVRAKKAKKSQSLRDAEKLSATPVPRGKGRGKRRGKMRGGQLLSDWIENTVRTLPDAIDIQQYLERTEGHEAFDPWIEYIHEQIIEITGLEDPDLNPEDFNQMMLNIWDNYLESKEPVKPEKKMKGGKY